MRDARTELAGTLKCVRSKVLIVRDHNARYRLVTLSHDCQGYLISKELFTEREIEKAKDGYCYFQLITSGGMRSVCDIVAVE